MPRKYVRKTRTKYTNEELKAAVDRVKAGESYYAVSRSTSVPYETLRRNDQTILKRQGSGGQVVLSNYEEELIVSTIITVSNNGFPMDRTDVNKLVKEYLDE